MATASFLSQPIEGDGPKGTSDHTQLLKATHTKPTNTQSSGTHFD